MCLPFVRQKNTVERVYLLLLSLFLILFFSWTFLNISGSGTSLQWNHRVESSANRARRLACGHGTNRALNLFHIKLETVYGKEKTAKSQETEFMFKQGLRLFLGEERRRIRQTHGPDVSDLEASHNCIRTAQHNAIFQKIDQNYMYFIGQGCSITWSKSTLFPWNKK